MRPASGFWSPPHRYRSSAVPGPVRADRHRRGFSTIPAAQIRDLATLRFVDAGESVILHGPVGVGKSMIAQALGHHACRRGHSVTFTKTSRLLADLAAGHADRSWDTRLARRARPTLLIFDDFAMRDFTLAQADDPYDYAAYSNMPRRPRWPRSARVATVPLSA